jgi:hypothetical protein
VRRLLSRGVARPTHRPLAGPRRKPARRAGRCIGRKVLPKPTAWKAKGRIRPVAIIRAVKIN